MMNINKMNEKIDSIEKFELLEKIDNYKICGYDIYGCYNVNSPIEELQLVVAIIEKKIFQSKLNQLFELVEILNDSVNSKYQIDIKGSFIDALYMYCKENGHEISRKEIKNVNIFSV